MSIFDDLDADPAYQRILKAAAEMGRQCRWSQRKIARDIGLTILPAGNPIALRSGSYVEVFESEPSDVTVLEPGEAEYLEAVKASK